MSSPRISIVIPVYNGSRYLREAIDSALAQTYQNLEVLVVDDGSQDDGATRAIIQSYGERVRCFSKENGGVSTALNYGIARATGSHICWLSHDDVFYPGKIQRQVEVLEAERSPAVLYTDLELIDADSQTLTIRRVVNLGFEGAGSVVLLGAPVNMCTTMVPKAWLMEVGGFNPALPTVQDVDMLLRLALRYPFKRVPEVLLKSRQHPGQGSRAVAAHARNVDAYLALKIEELTPLQLFGPGADVAKEYLRMATTFARARRHSAAAIALATAKTSWGDLNRSPLIFAAAQILGFRLLGLPGTRLFGIDLSSLDSVFSRRLYRLYHHARNCVKMIGRMGRSQ